jgi:hypothetical protein
MRQQHKGGKKYAQQIELMVASTLSSQNRFTGDCAVGADSDLAVRGPDQRTLAPS